MKFESDAEIDQISANFERGRFSKVSFHFYSDEEDEPPHIHVATPDGECKFWLQPVRLARNKGVSPLTIRKIEKIVFENQLLLMGEYNESRDK